MRHALGSGGRVRLVVERPGPQQPQHYEVTRVLEQEPRVVDLGTGVIVKMPPMELFGAGGSPVILLQKEIQAVARDDSFRRRLLDEIIGDDARRADLAVRRTAEDLGRNHRAIEEVERQLARREEYIERLDRLNAEIGFFEQQGWRRSSMVRRRPVPTGPGSRPPRDTRTRRPPSTPTRPRRFRKR